MNAWSGSTSSNSIYVLKINADPDPQPWFPHTRKSVFTLPGTRCPEYISFKNLSKKYCYFNLVRLFIVKFGKQEQLIIINSKFKISRKDFEQRKFSSIICNALTGIYCKKDFYRLFPLLSFQFISQVLHIFISVL
jgi:hypothetical protein